MEFLTTPSPSIPDPRNLYPCLATITLHPPSAPGAGGAGGMGNRRLSTGSYGSADGEEGGALRRVISGGRRKSSFGTSDAQPPSGLSRRLSFGTNANANAGATQASALGPEDEKNSGTWYWRVQAGVVDTHLVLKPLTQPPNPLLTSPPAPLSHAIPSHASHAAGGTLTEGGAANADEENTGLVGKMKKLFRRESAANVSAGGTTTKSQSTEQPPSPNAATTTTHTHPPPGDIKEEEVLDQTPQGEMLPSAKANAVGATNLNANAETGWPGVIHGEKLGAIIVALGGVDKHRVVLGGGKKGEGSYVTVPITSAFSHFVHPMLEAGSKGDSYPKSGTIKFEFDKDWIGAKGEAELLHHYITKAITSLPERQAPEPANLQLGSGHNTHAHTSPTQAFQEPFAASTGAGAGGAIAGHGHGLGEPVPAPDSSADSASGKVGGE